MTDDKCNKLLDKMEETFPKKYTKHIRELRSALKVYEMHAASEEKSTIVTYINDFSKLPFTDPPPIPPLRTIKKTLNKNHVGLKEVKDTILENISVLKLRDGTAKMPILLLDGPPGVGKCHGKGTEILMYDGSIKKVEDIAVGDQLMGDDSTPRNVLSLARGRDKMYKIIPKRNGKPYVVNSEHILCLRKGCKRFMNRKSRPGPKDTKFEKGHVSEISVKDYLQLKPHSDFRHYYNTYSVGVEFPQKSAKIDPYFLGVWLGDGSKSATIVTTMDDEIKCVLFSEAEKRNLIVREYKQESNKATTYHLSSTKSQKMNNSLLEDLREYNLLENKHIPEVYLRNSREVRMQVLAGLLDSDGHLCQRNKTSFSISQKLPRLTDDIIYLAKSLGFATSCKEKFVNKKGPYFVVNIYGEGVEEIPTKLSRKKAGSRKQVKYALASTFEVQELPEDDYYGFELDNNRRYLLGDFQVTHNTSVAKSIAEALKRPFASISLGGATDPCTIKGKGRMYVGAHPGRIIKCFTDTRSSHPVILIDEVDKIHHETVLYTLLDVLDKNQNNSFTDDYLEVGYDISNAIFITTANDIEGIHPAVRNRMERISLSSYTLEEKLLILRTQTLPQAIKANGLLMNHFAIDKSVSKFVIEGYTNEGGVRSLTNVTNKIARKLARQVIEKKRNSRRKLLTKKDIMGLLGPPRLEDENFFNTPPGVITGLAYTPYGGQVLMVESVKFHSLKPEVVVTGQPGLMSSESTKIVMSFLKSNHEKLGLDLNELSTNGVHISYPECTGSGVEGTSAGITMVTALVSLFKNKSVDPTICMTGEIDLRGNVVSIGGLREKLVSAHQKGKKVALIPKGNKPELAQVPKEVKDGLDIICVSNVFEALRVCGLYEVSN